MNLGILGGGLLLNMYLSPEGARPYTDVVGRVTTHLHLRGNLQDALTATICQDSFQTEADTNQAYQALAALKLCEIQKLQTRRQSNVLLLRSLDRVEGAAWEAKELTKNLEGGFLLAKSSWMPMDSYGMGPRG